MPEMDRGDKRDFYFDVDARRVAGRAPAELPPCQSLRQAAHEGPATLLSLKESNILEETDNWLLCFSCERSLSFL